MISLGSFFSRQPAPLLGLDISSSSVKLVELGRDKEGNLVLDNYDIVKKTGVNFTATSESFVVDVADGLLNIHFSALASEGGVNRPKVSAIEVIPYAGSSQERTRYQGRAMAKGSSSSGKGSGRRASAHSLRAESCSVSSVENSRLI